MSPAAHTKAKEELAALLYEKHRSVGDNSFDWKLCFAQAHVKPRRSPLPNIPDTDWSELVAQVTMRELGHCET